jgi:hypothetical protein
VGGRVAAGLAAGDFFAALVADKQVRLIAGPQDFKSSPLYSFVNSGMFGLQSTIATKHVAVQRFIAAMVKAAKFITDSSPQAIAAVLKGSSLGTYSTESTVNLVDSVEADRWFLDKSDGCISTAAWTGTLALAKGFDLPLSGKSLSDPIFSFSADTDLSLVKSAGVTC